MDCDDRKNPVRTGRRQGSDLTTENRIEDTKSRIEDTENRMLPCADGEAAHQESLTTFLLSIMFFNPLGAS